MPTLSNYTTSIPAKRSVQIIQDMLADAGATKVMVDYEAGQPLRVSFAIQHKGQVLPFCLEPSVAGVAAMASAARKTSRTKWSEPIDIAWRILSDLVRAQVAMVKAGNAEPLQVFLPYAQLSTGQSLYLAYTERPELLLGK